MASADTDRRRTRSRIAVQQRAPFRLRIDVVLRLIGVSIRDPRPSGRLVMVLMVSGGLDDVLRERFDEDHAIILFFASANGGGMVGRCLL